MMQTLMRQMEDKERKAEERELRAQQEKEQLMIVIREAKQQLQEYESSKKEISVTPPSETALPAGFMSPDDTKKVLAAVKTLRFESSMKKHQEGQRNERIIIDDMTQNRFLDEDEEKVRREEKKRRDKIIYEDESEEETHLESYVEWLVLRERLYPFDQSIHTLYRKRFSLLCAWGRYSEWLRTGFYLGFPVRLFGKQNNRWYLYTMQQYGIKLDRSGKKFRKVSDREVSVPAMSYDDRDARINVNSEEMDDLLPRAHVLRSLPVPLQFCPDKHELEKTKIISLQDYAKKMALLKRNRMRLLNNDNDDDPSSSSSSSSDDDAEEYDCNICGKVVRNRPYSDVCSSCEQVRKASRNKVKKEKSSSGDLSDLPHLEKDEDIKIYDHKQEMDKKIRSIIREERAVNGTLTSSATVPDSSPSDHVLGRIINEVFSASARRTLELTKLAKIKSVVELSKAANQLAVEIGKFDGDSASAPRWLHDYCRGVYRYDLI